MVQMLLTYFSPQKCLYLLRYQYLDPRGGSTSGTPNVISGGKTWGIQTGKTDCVMLLIEARLWDSSQRHMQSS